MEQRLILQDAIREASSQRKTELKIIEGMRNKAARIKDSQERGEYIKNISDMEANLTEVPTLPRLWTDDITPERLASLMAENHERMGIHSAEGGVRSIVRLLKGVWKPTLVGTLMLNTNSCTACLTAR